jgi:DNA-directed RNA polymerase subunit N (RpoN/RPB10)
MIVRCYECGNLISRYILFIAVAKQALYKENIEKKEEYGKIDPEKFIFNSDIIPPLQEVFDMLDIPLRCCRMHLTTITNIHEMYK